MTLYIANGVFCSFESLTSEDRLVVTNGTFALFSSGGNIIYSGSVGRFSVSCDIQQPLAYLLPVTVVNAGRFSCGPEIKVSKAGVFLKKYYSVVSSSGTSTVNLFSQGLGIYHAVKALLQVGVFVSASQSIRETLSHGDCIQVAQMLEAALPDGFTKNIKTINDLTEALRKLQKQQVGLSADEVVIVQSLLQSLAVADDIRVARKLIMSVSNPESRFESVPHGIYIDGRPL